VSIDLRLRNSCADIKVVDTARGEELARHYGIRFFETSAKSNINVKEAFYAISKDIKKRLMDSNTKQEPGGGNIVIKPGGGGGGGCCK